MRSVLFGIVSLFVAATLTHIPAGDAPAGPGSQQGAEWILPNGRRITPAGRQVTLGNFPLGEALSLDGSYLFVLNNGAGKQSIQVVQTATGNVMQTVPVPTAFNGVVVSPDGQRVFAAGGGSNKILTFDFADGVLHSSSSFPVSGYPSGLAISPEGNSLYVTCNLSRRVAVLNARTGMQTGELPTGLFPFAVALDRPGHKAYVTNWGDNSLAVVDTATNRVEKRVSTGGLPTALAVAANGRRVYIANANSDTVSVFDTATNTVVQNLSVAPYLHAPRGSAPVGLALSPDDRILYVTLAGNNAVLSLDTWTGKQLAAFPTAWYPTGIVCSTDGKSLYVLNSKGTGSGPNADGQYIGHMMPGTLSILSTSETTGGMVTVGRNNGWIAARPNPVLPRAIKHVVLIVRENRTYDQVLGDRSPGNGQASLCTYGRNVTPNLHALADRFAIGDNFYSDGEVSAQGHEWTLGANCPDYVEKTWMAYYSNRGRIRDAAVAPISYPENGFCIDHCLRNGVTCRMYGDAVRIGPGGRPLPGLENAFDPDYRGWDLDYPDVQRAAEWKREFDRGVFPAFVYLWLPNDHTAGTRLGGKTPRSLVADNDEATGRVIDAISHSRYWNETAIFLCEDDSQDGRDHVDAHRNVLLVASPWVRPGALTSHHYSQASIYATLERLLRGPHGGLPPMSQYDALADPIADIWSTTPDSRPFAFLPARIPLNERNTTRSAMWRESGQLDFGEPDDDRSGLLETILWRESNRLAGGH